MKIMNFSSFQQIIDHARNRGKCFLSVAAAQDKDVLKSVQEAVEQNLIVPILSGDGEQIKRYAADLDFNLAGIEIIDEPDPYEASLRAVEQVSNGCAQILMKGSVNSNAFLKAVLDKQVGLRTGKLLSHLAIVEVPSFTRLLFVTDGGINIAPDLNQKVVILENSVAFMNKLGYVEPKVAVLSANEVVIPQMASTEEGAMLSKMAERKQLKNCIVDGPLSLDLAISLKSVAMKGIDSKVAGQAQLLLAPNIESGNIFCKALVYFAKAEFAGVVLGARAPIVMTSRSDSSRSKIASIAIASLGR
ncbi:MAG: bifunctional enoyl-CoA hydratase/phosphate acetyltransferase [Bacillota bacterium]|nr:bifunctional enoyl-CoA hydratase/phosphate acetyltransferase [Bacillota bacterium]